MGPDLKTIKKFQEERIKLMQGKRMRGLKKKSMEKRKKGRKIANQRIFKCRRDSGQKSPKRNFERSIGLPSESIYERVLEERSVSRKKSRKRGARFSFFCCLNYD